MFKEHRDYKYYNELFTTNKDSSYIYTYIYIDVYHLETSRSY